LEKRGGTEVCCRTTGAYPHIGVNEVVEGDLGRSGQVAGDPELSTMVVPEVVDGDFENRLLSGFQMTLMSS
jgi:hypothetical protein